VRLNHPENRRGGFGTAKSVAGSDRGRNRRPMTPIFQVESFSARDHPICCLALCPVHAVISRCRRPVSRARYRCLERDGATLVSEIRAPALWQSSPQRLLRKLLKEQGFASKRITMDKPKSYAVAIRNERPTAIHDQGLRANNRAVNSHQPVRRRERKQQCGVSVPLDALFVPPALNRLLNISRGVVAIAWIYRQSLMKFLWSRAQSMGIIGRVGMSGLELIEGKKVSCWSDELQGDLKLLSTHR
jgi:hypothetical protein